MNVPGGLIGGLAIAAFVVAILAALLTPVVSRLHGLEPWKGPLRLVPYGLLAVGAALAIAAAALGTATADRAGVREVTSVALAILCLTPLVGAIAVRARYGAPGGRTFREQIAANQGSSILLVAVLFEIMVVTGFLVGATIGLGFESALLGGLIVAGISTVVTLGATGVAWFSGDGLVLDVSDAKEAGSKEQQLRNVVAELAMAAGVPAPKVYVIATSVPNAMSVGRDPRHGAIAVTRGLLDQLDREELQGVVAHELAHIANLDSRHAVLVALLVGAVVLLTDVFFHLVIEVARNPWVGGDDIKEMVGALFVWAVVVIVGLVVAGLLKLLAPFAALAVQAAVSRDREYLADATAVGITRNPAGLERALAKLDASTVSMPGANRGTQHLWIVNPLRDAREGGRGWFETHPATSDRIVRLRALSGVTIAGNAPSVAAGGSPDGATEAVAAPDAP